MSEHRSAQRREGGILPVSSRSAQLLSIAHVDILIRGGVVVDGSGASPFRGDIAVAGDKIAAVGGDLSNIQAGRVINAEGLIVSPGFVDIHSHSDLLALISPKARSRVYDGVTTEICGNCGFSYFPHAHSLRRAHEESLAKYGLTCSWDDAAGFFQRVEQVGSAINRAFLVGHGAIRATVMEYDARPPDARELAEMHRHLERSLAAGAFGISSGMAYSPGCFANAAEIISLCKIVKEHGGLYATHIRNEGEQLIESVEEALEVARSSGVRLEINHIKTFGPRNWGKIDALEEKLFAALREGIDLGCDRYPYTAASSSLDYILPKWVAEGGRERELERIQDAAIRRRIVEETERIQDMRDLWTRISICSVNSEKSRCLEGLSIQDVAEKRGLAPWDAFFELLVEEKAKVSALFFMMCEENLLRILRWPFVAVGSDGSARDPSGTGGEGKPHPRSYGTFARTFALCVREKKILSLEEAVAKMSAIPAARVGLDRRGMLREGFFADVAVFDPRTFSDRATYSEPHRLSTGLRYLLVNGALILEDGVQTEALAGRLLRK